MRELGDQPDDGMRSETSGSSSVGWRTVPWRVAAWAILWLHRASAFGDLVRRLVKRSGPCYLLSDDFLRREGARLVGHQKVGPPARLRKVGPG
jgi:hypothetical protein